MKKIKQLTAGMSRTEVEAWVDENINYILGKVKRNSTIGIRTIAMYCISENSITIAKYSNNEYDEFDENMILFGGYSSITEFQNNDGRNMMVDSIIEHFKRIKKDE